MTLPVRRLIHAAAAAAAKRAQGNELKSYLSWAFQLMFCDEPNRYKAAYRRAKDVSFDVIGFGGKQHSITCPAHARNHPCHEQ
jgi:hypothetical protein